MRAILTIAILFSALFAKAQAPVYIFPGDEDIYLRWKGLRDANLTGYNVYRKGGGQAEWQLLTEEPLTFVQSKSEGFALAGNEAEILYNLLGKNSGAITAAEVAAASGAQSGSIFDAMTVANPAAAKLLGEWYRDATAVKGTAYSYRITTIVSGAENEWSTAALGVPFSAKALPRAKEVDIDEGDQTVSLAYEPDEKDLKSGDVVSWHVYRTDRENGDFRRISFENPIPVSINTGGGATGQRLSHTDRYLENGKTYYYRVKLVNAAGVESRFSKTFPATPASRNVVIPLSGFDVSALSSRALVSWNSEVDEGDYRIFSSGDTDTEPFKSRTSGIIFKGKGQWLDTEYVEGMTRYYYMELQTPAGKTWRTDTLQLMALDRVAPQPPDSVRAEILDSVRVQIRWSAVKSRDIYGYDIERLVDANAIDGVMINRTSVARLSYIDTLPKNGYGRYYYRVIANDASANRSIPSQLAAVTFPDKEPPQTPIFWRLDRRGDTLLLEWHPVPDLDLAHYTVNIRTGSEKWLAVDSVSDTEYRFRADTSGSYYFAIEAVDTSGNRSGYSQVLHQTVKPKPPEPPAITGVEKRGKGLVIQWEEVDSTRISHVILTRINPRKDEQYDIWEGSPRRTSFFDKYGDADKAWRYELHIFDAGWRKLGNSTYSYEPPENE